MMFELRVTSCELRCDSRDATHRRGRPSVRRRLVLALDSRLSSLDRHGLTLIELLITITILATLAAMFLGASNAAMESARAARTKTTISKIHTLLMERWGSYTTRRVEIKQSEKEAINKIIDSAGRGRRLADARLNALRELMKLEMPDRWSDLIGASVGSSPPSDYPFYLDGRPSLSLAYLRRYDSLTGTPSEREDNQGAECLYMVIMLATGDGEARTLFSRQDIGDTDGDGALEFLDGWGRPIHFLRWPAGFAEAGLSSLMPADAYVDHDPFDYFRQDNPPNPIGPGENTGYRLVPLVYSGGPDGDPDLYTAKGGPLIDDPYKLYQAPVDRGNSSAGEFNAKIGTPMSPSTINIDPANDGDNWHDNIHNHLQDGR